MMALPLMSSSVVRTPVYSVAMKHQCNHINKKYTNGDDENMDGDETPVQSYQQEVYEW
jgi:hypothetical protein